jgi:glyoxylase I family protein
MKGSNMRLQNLVPVLDVRDVEESIEFYRSTLGFSVYDKVEWGGRTEWALLRSGQVQLMLCASEDEGSKEVSAQSDSVFFVFLDDADALPVYLGVEESSVSGQPATDDLQSRDFYLRDPDGYVLWFSHRPLGSKPAGAMVPDSSAVFA